MAQLSPATRRASYAGTTTQAIPKEPHTVNPHLRNLARGENCTGLRYGSYCHCDPATTVLAHTNTQADAKGMGYKAHDHMGAFLGFDCHAWLDQGNGTADERAAFMAAAQERTRERWAQIASDPMAARGSARPRSGHSINSRRHTHEAPARSANPCRTWRSPTSTARSATWPRRGLWPSSA
jgi:hypothetical protein